MTVQEHISQLNNQVKEPLKKFEVADDKRKVGCFVGAYGCKKKTFLTCHLGCLFSFLCPLFLTQIKMGLVRYSSTNLRVGMISDE